MVTSNTQTTLTDSVIDPVAKHAATVALDTAGFARRTGTRISEILEQVQREYPEWSLAKRIPPKHLA